MYVGGRGERGVGALNPRNGSKGGGALNPWLDPLKVIFLVQVWGPHSKFAILAEVNPLTLKLIEQLFNVIDFPRRENAEFS